jgi:nucleoside-diphosphate-sugar epimerase
MKYNLSGDTSPLRKKILFLGGGPIVESTILSLCKESEEYEIILLSDSICINSQGFELVTVEPLQNWVQLNLNHIDIVVLAWRYIKDEKELMKMKLIESLLKFNSDRMLLIYLSSVSVYGQSLVPSSEDDLVHPINKYGITKFEMENTLQSLSNGNILILRISNVFGHHKFDDFINRITRASKWPHYIKVVEPRKVARDFIEIGNLVRVLRLLFDNHNHFLTNRNLIMNVSSGKSILLQDVLDLAEKFFELCIDSIPIPENSDMIIKSQISNEFLKSYFPLLQFHPSKEINDYLFQCIQGT